MGPPKPIPNATCVPLSSVISVSGFAAAFAVDDWGAGAAGGPAAGGGASSTTAGGS
jgi:hypothetical protein